MRDDGRDSAGGPVHPADDPGRGVFGISVASDLVGTGVQNLRAYERAGLLTPDRTAGGTRLYSPDDVARLRRIQRLLAGGLNLAGVARVLDLEDDEDKTSGGIPSDAEDGVGAVKDQVRTAAQLAGLQVAGGRRARFAQKYAGLTAEETLGM